MGYCKYIMKAYTFDIIWVECVVWWVFSILDVYKLCTLHYTNRNFLLILLFFFFSSRVYTFYVVTTASKAFLYSYA